MACSTQQAIEIDPTIYLKEAEEAYKELPGDIDVSDIPIEEVSSIRTCGDQVCMDPVHMERIKFELDRLRNLNIKQLASRRELVLAYNGVRGSYAQELTAHAWTSMRLQIAVEELKRVKTEAELRKWADRVGIGLVFILTKVL